MHVERFRGTFGPKSFWGTLRSAPLKNVTGRWLGTRSSARSSTASKDPRPTSLHSQVRRSVPPSDRMTLFRDVKGPELYVNFSASALLQLLGSGNLSNRFMAYASHLVDG